MSEDWFNRLVVAVNNCGKSKRAISLDAGLSETYVHQMVRYEKVPTVDKFMRICDSIGVNSVEILTGGAPAQHSPHLSKLFSLLSEQTQDALLTMLETILLEKGRK